MPVLFNLVTLPFIGEVNLSSGLLVLFLLCLVCVAGFEFVNGFHDTANAVATVIYTKALKPMVAVPWSGAFNFLGVFTGGVAVAMGILKLVPLNELMALPTKVGAAMVLAVLLSSIIWNLGTWWMGIPCSSSHTLFGSLIGAGLGFAMFYKGSVNWSKAGEIGMSLVLSPLFGFGAAVLLMLFLRHVVRSPILFHAPTGEDDRPPIMIRLLLITTCTLVSFFHGSNDGQKGVGLLMLILIAFVPAKFALDSRISDEQILASLTHVEQSLPHLNGVGKGQDEVKDLGTAVIAAKTTIAGGNSRDEQHVFALRKQIQTVVKDVKAVMADPTVTIPASDRSNLSTVPGALTKTTDYAPIWCIAMISLSLGIGTMIGWKRIVLTIGEKIGKEHLNYAQGASAELIAASTIGLSTWFGLPVSTTHVLSSGIAGAMVASNGKKNLNPTTLKAIAMAWVLTLPVSMLLGLGLFLFFHLFV
ncbi:MAG TPA: inorganic phosphate transporter [Puia sp.]|jgi:PiT family inorganic phosphate transporter